MTFILQWNMNGFFRHKEELVVLIRELNPDCICLQETHFKLTDKSVLKGFNIFRHDDTSGQRAQGGVAIAFREALYTSRVQLNTPLQAIAMTVHAPEAITLCNVYLPEGAPVSRVNLESLVCQLPRPYILLGDFNAHDTLWGSTRAQCNQRGHTVTNFINDLNLFLLNNGEKTRFNSFNGTFSSIDLSISTGGLMPRLDWSVHNDLCGSDHYPILITKDGGLNHRLTQPSNWVVRRANWSLFKRNFYFKHDDNVNGVENIKTLTDNILEAADSTVPRSKGRSHRPTVPWWNEECAKAIQVRKRALRIFSKYPTATNLTSFRRLRAKARKVVKEAKRASWEKYVSDINYRTPITDIWRKIKSISGSNYHLAVSSLKEADRVLTTPPEISECFGRRLAETSCNGSYDEAFRVLKEQNETIPLTFNPRDSGEVYNDPFSLWELSSAILESRDGSPGIDTVHNAFLRNLPKEALPQMLRSLNQIWSEGSFPAPWRESIVVPILKQGKDRSDPNNYRPISLTSCVCKVMERMVNRRLVWWLERRNLLSDIQCGFRRGRSTSDHLVRTDNFIQEAFLLRQNVIGVFFDLEKAYDRVWRYKILKTLDEWGFRGNLPIFVKNFLSARVFKVRIGEYLSRFYPQENGVPQGSVLSVTLFAIAINDVAECIRSPVMGSLFVDDLAIFCRSSKLTSASRLIQLTLNKLSVWSQRNGFRFSTEKTKCIHFYRGQGVHVPPSLYLNGNELPYVENVRFLGMTLDRRLNWRDHFRILRDNCFKVLNILRFLSHSTWGADRTSMLMLYRALVRSRLDYGSIVYSSARDTYMKPLSTVHNTGLRLATGAFRTSPVLSIYADTGEPPLVNRREKLMCNYAIKILSAPNHPCYSIISRPLLLDLFNRKTRSTKPLSVRFRNLIAERNFTLAATYPTGYSNTPPWLIPRPDLRLRLTRCSKSTTMPGEYQQLFKEFRADNSECTFVYTDGSKSNTSCGCAVVSPYHGVLKAKLHPYCSVFTAELTAIRIALRSIKNSIGSFMICTDSYSALQSISVYSPGHPIVQDIQSTLLSLSKKGTTIRFAWIPGHVGITGNEKADAAAKDALRSPDTEVPLLPAEDLGNAMRNILRQNWKTQWLEIENNKLREIKADITAWQTSVRNVRREEVVLARLRIGHCVLTHSYLFTEEKTQPRCLECDCSLTVRHILTDCERYRIARVNHSLKDNLDEVLGDNPENVSRLIAFLRSTDLFNKI